MSQSGLQNQHCNYIMRFIIVLEVCSIYINVGKWVVSKHGSSTKGKPACGRVSQFFSGWSAGWSLIFCRLLVGVSRFVVGALRPLATPWMQAWVHCAHSQPPDCRSGRKFSSKRKAHFNHVWPRCPSPWTRALTKKVSSLVNGLLSATECSRKSLLVLSTAAITHPWKGNPRKIDNRSQCVTWHSLSLCS